MESILREAKEKYDELPPSIKEEVILEHTPLVRYIVNRIAVRLPSHIDLDDLQSTGVIGLMDAIDKYDPEKNCKFKTYAEFRIKGAILDQLRSLDWVPRSVRQRSRNLESAYGELEQRCGVRLTGGQERVRAVVPTPAERRLISLPEGEAALENTQENVGEAVENTGEAIQGNGTATE